MNELEYQLDLSDTLDSGNVTGHENDEDDVYSVMNGEQNKFPDPSNVIMLSESEAAPDKIAKHFDDFHVQLCEACSSSLPLVSFSIFVIYVLSWFINPYYYFNTNHLNFLKTL